jgi:dephospho-CoA kinase
MIIGLIGKKRVGKDTVASIIKEYSFHIMNDITNDISKCEYKTMALADPIKDIARIMFNFTEEQLYDCQKDEIDTRWNIKPREFFEQFGTDIMQFDIYKYLPSLEKTVPQRKFWVHSLLSKINKHDNVIITDVRGQHEVDEIIKYYPNAKFIHITRNPKTNSITKQGTDHITQQEPEQISKKYISAVIDNNGTIEDLKEKVKAIIYKLNLENEKN